NRQWQRHEAETEVLEYDIMQTPHHCSWHSLSYDSWSKCGEKAKLDADARKALSQTRDGAVIVASCKPIKADDSDPPCIRAKREYVEIVEEAKGEFYCTGEYPSEKSVEPLVFTVTSQGVQPPSKKEAGSKAAAVITSARTPMPHGAS
ncbi:metallohydrolase, partial [Pseudomonas aeruginosa]